MGTNTGKWVVLSASTREVFSVNQESGGGEPVHSCKFSPDGSMLALGSRDFAVYIYQVTSGGWTVGNIQQAVNQLTLFIL